MFAKALSFIMMINLLWLMIFLVIGGVSGLLS